MSTTSRGPSRRTLVKGAAWSVPVVAVAGAAPAHAASPGQVILTQVAACKSPGNSCKTFKKGYIFTFNVTSTWSCPVNVLSGTFTVLSGSTPGTLTVDPFTIQPGANQTIEVTVRAQNSGNSAFTAWMCLTYEGDCVDGTVSETPDSTVDPCTLVTVTGTPPDCDCPGGTTPATVETEAVEPPAETTAVVEDTAKTETITPVAPSTGSGTTDVSTTDEASTTAQP